MYSPMSSLIDPPAHNPIAEGVVWAQRVALGSVATTVAVVAVAVVGLLMLSGRLELRRGITVVLGCFMLFGADAMSSAIVGLTGADAAPTALDEAPPSPLPSNLQTPALPLTSYDPYAGASVPVRR